VVSPGSLVDIYGTGLATAAATTPGLPLPATLGGVQVTVNGTAAPLYYVSSGLIVFPDALLHCARTGAGAGEHERRARSGCGDHCAIGCAQHSDVWKQPRRRPESGFHPQLSYQLRLAGKLFDGIPDWLWSVDSTYRDRRGSSGGPALLRDSYHYCDPGNAQAPVTFAGMTPGLIGLMQVNLQVPKVSGDLPLQIKLGGVFQQPSVGLRGNATLAARQSAHPFDRRAS